MALADATRKKGGAGKPCDGWLLSGRPVRARLPFGGALARWPSPSPLAKHTSHLADELQRALRLVL
jgi:hypothetical protein